MLDNHQTPTKTFGIGAGSAANLRYLELAARTIAKASKSDKIIVEKVNVATCHTKPRRQGETGGIVKRETPIRACKVALFCEKCGKGVRVAHKIVDGKKTRVCCKCGAEL